MKRFLLMVIAQLTIAVMWGGITGSGQSGSALAATPASPTSSKPAMKLRITGHNPEATEGMRALKRFAERVTQATGGRVQFDLFFGGSLAKAGEEMDALKRGLADVGWLGYGFHPAEFPLGNYTSMVPFNPTDPELFQKIQEELYAKVPAFHKELELQNVIYLSPVCAGSYELNSRKSVTSLAEMKGLKTATFGTHMPKLVGAAGAVSVAMPATERYTALQTGVIDAQILGIPYIYTMRLYQVAPNITYLSLGNSVTAAYVINRDTWNRLPTDVQKIIAVEGIEAGRWLAKELKRGMDDYAKQMAGKGVKFFTLSESDKQRWGAQMPDLLGDWVKAVEAKGVNGWQILNLYKNLAEQAGHRFPKGFGIK